MTERERLTLALDTDQWHSLLILADACEEAGEGTTAAGLRYLAVERLWPLRTAAGWEWWLPNKKRGYSCSLPAAVLTRVRRLTGTPRGETVCFATAGDALMAAARCVVAPARRQARTQHAGRDLPGLVAG